VNAGFVALDDAIAAVTAAFPVTPERAAANARLLDEEVAAYENEHALALADPDAADPAA